MAERMSARLDKVFGMDLETRVTTLERDVRFVQELEIPSLRSEMERKYDYLRSEASGWFKIAMETGTEADNKVTGAGDLLTLIYRDLRVLKEGQAHHGELIEGLAADVGTLKADVGTLKADVGTLKADVGTLKADVGTLKADVGTLKADVGTLKADVGTLKTEVAAQRQILNQHSATMGEIRSQLDGQGVVLQKILARLS
jgi:outer membrane murein-binding lipoprotein Lpp